MGMRDRKTRIYFNIESSPPYGWSQTKNNHKLTEKMYDQITIQ
jgi:hypothetical protein